MIRGLALRTLSALRLPSVVEYMMPSLKAGLTDSAPYVRGTAVMSVLKLYHLNPELVKEDNMVDMLYDMMRDRDGRVASCLSCGPFS